MQTIVDWEARARSEDERDELRAFRERFYVQSGVIYLDGNSLGLLSRDAEASLLNVLEAWKTQAIEGWTGGASPWFYLAEELSKQTASLIGAQTDQVIVTNSTTVNLHQLLATLYAPDPVRPHILADALNFPSDLYALQSHLRQRGRKPENDLILVPARETDNGPRLDETDIVAHMTPDVQLVVLPSVVFTSGQLLDMEYLTAQAHERGILIGFDLSHSVGAVPHELDAHDVDFAFWCSYKYLNGGPGASGGLYLNRRHFGRPPGLAGWFSSHKARQFDMTATLSHGADAGALQIGTPNILSMAPMQGALEMIAQAGIHAMRRKSLGMTEFLITLADAHLRPYGVIVANPREPERRGGHVSLLHPEASRICRALRAQDVIPDFRPPNIIRLAPSPLYTSFAECLRAIEILQNVMGECAYTLYSQERDIVP